MTFTKLTHKKLTQFHEILKQDSWAAISRRAGRQADRRTGRKEEIFRHFSCVIRSCQRLRCSLFASLPLCAIYRIVILRDDVAFVPPSTAIKIVTLLSQYVLWCMKFDVAITFYTLGCFLFCDSLPAPPASIPHSIEFSASTMASPKWPFWLSAHTYADSHTQRERERILQSSF